jgi:histone acetyltransferase (RNA polymerase elongator complex component)
MIGHILKHKNELVYRIIQGKIEVKRIQRHSRTSFVKQMISVAGLSSYMDTRIFIYYFFLRQKKLKNLKIYFEHYKILTKTETSPIFEFLIYDHY